MVSTPLLIGGEERHGAATFPVYDPAHTGAIVGHAAAASADDALDAVAAAHAAWPAWAALSATERTAIVLKALDGLDADAVQREREGPLRGHDRPGRLRRAVPPGGGVRPGTRP